MSVTGRCHCSAISFIAEGKPLYHSICHCNDCRRWSGAPAASWMAFKIDQVTIIGHPVSYHSSKNAIREFCGACGTGLFYRNATLLPGIIDIQSGTLDNLTAYAPTEHIMTKDKLSWIDQFNELPQFQKYPGME